MKQKVFGMFVGSVVVVLLSFLLNGDIKIMPVQNNPAALIGVLDLEKAMSAHPRYDELRQYDQEIIKHRAAASKAAVSDSGAAKIETTGIVATEIADYQKSLAQQMDAKMMEKKQALFKIFAANVAEKQQEINRHLNIYAQELDQEYQPETLSRQLKLQALKLTPEAKESLQAELMDLQEARMQKIKQRQNELEDDLREEIAVEQNAAEEKLRQYHSQLLTEAERELADKRQEMKSRNTDSAAGGLLGERLNTSTEQRDLRILEQQKAKLMELMLKNLQDATTRVAAQRNLEVVFVKYQQNVQSVDVTDAVIAEVKK